MPPVAAGAAAFAGFLASGTIAATIVGSIITMAITTLISSIFKAKIPAIESQARKVTIRSGVAPCRVIYGEHFGGGVMVYAASTGKDNKYMHMVIVHCCHSIESVDGVWFGDKPSSHPDFSNVVMRVKELRFTGGPADNTGAITFTLEGIDYVHNYVSTDTYTDIRDEMYDLITDLDGYYIRKIDYLDVLTTGASIRIEKINADTVSDWDFTSSIAKTGSDTEILVSQENITGQASTKEWFRFTHHLGDDDQVADSDLVSEVSAWTSAHRLRGCAYSVIRLEYDEDVWDSIPAIKFLIRGKNDIEDTRAGTTGYETNWALCVRNYLMYQHGLAVNSDRLPEDEWESAADICDEEFRAAPKYVMNGSFTLDQQPPDILEGMKTASQGQIVYTGGLWIAKPAAYDAPVKTITTDDLISDIVVTPAQSKFDTANSITGSYIEPDALYSSTNYPAVKDQDSIDRFKETTDTVDLPYTTDAHTAQMLAGIRLGHMMHSASVQLEINLSAIDIRAWDVIELDIPEIWDSKQSFRVVSVSLSIRGVTLICQEEDADIYIPVTTVDVDIPEREYIRDTAVISGLFPQDSSA